MALAEGRVEGEKVFGGRVFPKTYFPPTSSTCESGSSTCDQLVEMVRKDRASLGKTLEQHGAILFRGFGVASVEDFARVVEAFGWEELPYEGAANRNKKADRIYTANEAPLDLFIPFHHEMALIKAIPSKIFFFCMQPSPEGGETAIIPSNVIVEKMEAQFPQVVEKLSRVGMTTVLHAKDADKNGDVAGGAHSKVWHRMLKTDNEFEAEKRAIEKLACNSVKFNGDGTADFFYGPMNPIREFGGKRVWFNTIMGYTTKERDAHSRFSDGSPFPLEALEAYNNILEENCVDLAWKKEDVLLVDNLGVQHARRSGKPPRSVLVSLCK